MEAVKPGKVLGSQREGPAKWFLTSGREGKFSSSARARGVSDGCAKVLEEEMEE